MNTEEERNRILSNLRDLNGIPTEDYTITERRMIKDWSDKAKVKKIKMNHLIPNLYGEYEVVQKTGCDSRGS